MAVRPTHLGMGALLALALACAAPAVVPVPSAEVADSPFAFLRDGVVSREEVLLRLGTPSAHLEGERILTYSFQKAPAGWSRTGRWWRQDRGWFEYHGRAGYPYNLVLVFGPDGRLLRHSLLVTR